MTPDPPETLEDRLLLGGARLALVVAAAALLLRLPLGEFNDWLPVKNCLVVLFSVALGGKVLYDTLFYDRFRP